MRLVPLACPSLFSIALISAASIATAIAAEPRSHVHVYADYGRSATEGLHNWDLGLGLGWRHAGGFGVELQHLPKLFDVRVTSTFTSSPGNDLVFSGRFGAETTALMFGWTFPFGSSPWSMTAQLGAHKPDYYFPSGVTGGLAEGIRAAGGLHLSYAATKHWDFGLCFSRYNLDETPNIERAAVRAGYRF